MKLIEITNLNTTIDYTNIADEIITKCKPFLQLIDYQTNKYVLYRGAGRSSMPVNILPGHRSNRNPKDTPLFLHRAINTIFKQIFGVPFRDGTFTTGDYNNAIAFGSMVYVVIPIGKFEFLWSKEIIDLFDFFRIKIRHDFGKYEDIYSNNPAMYAALQKFVKTSEFTNLYQNTHLKPAIESGREVMLYCDQCYYIKKDIYTDISDIITTYNHSNV